MSLVEKVDWVRAYVIKFNGHKQNFKGFRRASRKLLPVWLSTVNVVYSNYSLSEYDENLNADGGSSSWTN